jgi:hypothetical protein
MRIRIFNTCSNTHLLDKYGVDGVEVYIKDGKDSRRICACGSVTSSNIDTCPICGNTTWKHVGGERAYWYRPATDINIKTVDEYEFKKIMSDEYHVVLKYLNLWIDTSAQTFALSEKEEVAAIISSSNMEFMNLTGPKIRVDLKDINDFIKENTKNIEDEDLRDDVIRTYEISALLFNGKDNYVSRIYSINTFSSVRSILTDENISTYKRFWIEILNKYRFDNSPITDPWAGHRCTTMEEFFEVLHLPIDFKPYYMSKNFNLYYGWYRSINIDLKQYNKLPNELKKTIKYSIEHQIIYLHDVYQMVEWSKTQTEEKLILLAKFLKKHGMTFMQRIFDAFKERLRVVEEKGWDLNAVVSLKQFSVLQVEELLERRKFPRTRIDGLLNCVDNNAMLAVELLTSKGQLKKDEAKKIYK